MGLVTKKDASILLVLIIAVVPACKKSNPATSQGKFAVNDSIRNRSSSRPLFLINTVKNSDGWRIDYGFADEYCIAEVKAKTAELKNAISYALQLWLKPIEEKAKEVEKKEQNLLTNGFTYKESTAFSLPYSHEVGDMSPRHVLGQEVANDPPHLRVIFYCDYGMPFTSAYGDPSIPTMHYTYTNLPDHIYITGTKYSMDVLIHEIGHAFGLDDTYPPQ